MHLQLGIPSKHKIDNGTKSKTFYRINIGKNIISIIISCLKQWFPTWCTWEISRGPPYFHPFKIYTKIINENLIKPSHISQGKFSFFVCLEVREQKKVGNPRFRGNNEPGQVAHPRGWQSSASPWRSELQRPLAPGSGLRVRPQCWGWVLLEAGRGRSSPRTCSPRHPQR